MSDKPLHEIMIAWAEECRKEHDDPVDGCNKDCAACQVLIEYEADIRFRIAEFARKYIAEDATTI